MAGLDYQTTALFLSQLGVTPSDTPAEFDRLGRELGEWFERGGSCREFVELHKNVVRAESCSLPVESRSLPDPVPDWRTAATTLERLAILRRRYVPPG